MIHNAEALMSEILYIDGERHQALSRLTQATGIDVASQQ